MENKDKIIEKMLELQSSISEELKNRGQEIDKIGFYKEISFNGAGLAVNDVFVVKLKEIDKPKSKENEDQLEKEEYEIYDKDQNLIATVGMDGSIEFSQEFLEQLKTINEDYFNTLNLDEAELELPEELERDDIALTKNELDGKQIEKQLDQIAEITGENRENIKSYSTIGKDEKPKFEQLTNKQEIDANVRVTQNETLADLIPEIKQKNIQKIGVVYSDYSKGQSGRFSFVGLDQDNKVVEIESLQNIDGTTTGQKVTSINSVDGSIVEQEQVAGMVKLSDRAISNGEEEFLSIRQGNYGILEIDYVRADLSKPEDERYISAPIETRSEYPTSREVRDFIDKRNNPDIKKEIDRANPEIERDDDAELRNIDDTASNDMVTPDTIIVLENGEETTIRKEALKARVSPEEFARRYNDMGGETPDKKIEAIHDDIEAEYGAPSRSSR